MFTKITVQNTIYFCGVYFIFHNLMKYKHVDHEENLLNDLKHSNLFNKIFKSLLNYTINVHVFTVLKQMPSKCYSLKLLMTMNQGDISKKTFKSGERKQQASNFIFNIFMFEQEFPSLHILHTSKYCASTGTWCTIQSPSSTGLYHATCFYQRYEVRGSV